MRRRGTTLKEVMVAVAVLFVCGALLVAVTDPMGGCRRGSGGGSLPDGDDGGPGALGRVAAAREEARRIRCRNNLNQLAKGMYTYLMEFGDNRFYPCPLGRGAEPNDYNGAEWLASLYWTGLVPDPGVFLCPGTRDSNAQGRHLGRRRASAAFGPRTVSYAGMHYYSMTERDGTRVARAIRDDFPPNMPMGSDDTQATVNHGEANNGGMSVLFFDSHVEFKTNKMVDLERGVGYDEGPGGPKHLLWQLRN
ncbi:MAG: type II secretion system protein [Candidatus Brocadiia bacterium]